MDEQQQQQIAALLGVAESGPFEELIGQLMSASNEQRSHAESLYNLCRDHQPDGLVLKLASLLHSSPSPDVRAMSAVLLRKLLTHGGVDSDAGLWRRLPPSFRSSIQSLLLSVLRGEPDCGIVKKVAATVSGLAASLLPESAWPDLLPFLFNAISAPDATPSLQESALLVFSDIANVLADDASFVSSHLATLHSLFLDTLSHPSSLEVRIAALSAAVELVISLESPKDRNQLADLLPSMMRTLNDSLNSGQEAAAQEALGSLVELADIEPRFLRDRLADVVGAMLQIAEADGLEDGTRHLAIEFVITLAEPSENGPGMMRKFPQFVGRLFAILMKMLLDIEDHPAWHSAEVEDEDAGETSNYNVAQECLDRLAVAVGGNTIVPIASELLPAYLVAPEWQKHHAALMVLSQIAEGCSKVMLKSLKQVTDMILSSFQDPHPRVRWAAIHALGRLSTDLGPDLQVMCHSMVFPALASVMDDFQHPRVQAHAASALLNFCENCTRDILTPYLDGIVSKLLVLLQNGKQMVQEEAVSALASVADSSEELFQRYYDAVMPLLKAIMMNATNKSNRMLRAKAMECISFIAIAVGKEKFRDDAKQIMEVMMALQISDMEADDPTTSYMLQAWTRLCKCLGQDFLPYMSVVMPPLLQSAQLKPEFPIDSTNSDDDIDDSDDSLLNVATFTIGGKQIGIRTSVLEEKATACHMLCCYANELKEGFYPWIDQVAPILVPLLKFYFDEEVRQAAVAALPELLQSAKLAVENGQAQGRDQSYVKQLLDHIVPALVEALKKEPESVIIASMLDSLNECIQLAGSQLSESQVKSVVDQIKVVIKASASRKKERAKRTTAEDFDAEEEEMLNEKNELEDDIFDQVGNCLGTLIKTFKASFIPYFDELSIYITPMLDKDKTTEERRIAICIFDDVIEQCQEAALKYYDAYLPFTLEACNDENADVRQAALYGVGLCAEFGGYAFRPLLGEVLLRLNNVISHPDALHPDNVMAYDNAVSALGKICKFHPNSIDLTKVFPVWLSCLPIRNDLIEAKIVHEQLCSMVERSGGDLLGPNSQHISKIVSVFAEVLYGGKDLATEQTISRIVNFLRQLHQTLPPSVLTSTWSTLQPQQQLALQSALSP